MRPSLFHQQPSGEKQLNLKPSLVYLGTLGENNFLKAIVTIAHSHTASHINAFEYPSSTLSRRFECRLTN